ncbi:SDR family NAD(P)-dependent oxidoreductase [Parasphingopyxis marina]|uniref:SDR family oxidoreductase n=1 Tax=Parasphingopyxis marina TaxID=2761622 RepID=A0A842I2I0_9SPHN|nr:SDR family oxidoreductase [Parasphingopyxis marina]MBC2778953.1 SDR family oxidoreductase [Parasphingopyxis marina]
MRYTDKTVLITGAATGIGRATASAFAREGAAVMIGDLDEGAAQTVTAIEEMGGRAAWRHCDVSDLSETEALIADCATRFGGLHAAFNNAGILTPFAPLHDTDPADYTHVMAVNAGGVFNAMRAEISWMIEHGGGAIVNTASVGGVIANPGMAPYIAAKHAVVGLTRTAALDYARLGIRTNAICPGLVRTAMTADWFEDATFIDSFYESSPIGRAAEPAEIAGMVLHLCSDEASFTNGAVITMDGGQTAI